MTTGAWIAEVIRTQQGHLVHTTTEIVRARVPEYAALPEAQVQIIFAQVYEVFARSLETDDMAPWRAYFQAVLGPRARVRITPAGMIATVDLVRDQTRALAEHQPDVDSIRAAEIRSLLRGQANRIRLVVSELHLARLTDSPSDPSA